MNLAFFYRWFNVNPEVLSIHMVVISKQRSDLLKIVCREIEGTEMNRHEMYFTFRVEDGL
jgi:hypothetical protein